MITILLLTIIYLAFISLGLPDSLLGVAWPAMRSDFGLPLDAAGLYSLIAVGGTIASSLLSGHMIRRFGTGKVTFLSCALTTTALLGISSAPSYPWIILMAIPMGFGAGSVDAALNNYVAHHFKAHHMNWLHSFWGVGATIGPVLMGRYLLTSSWRDGYRTIGSIQFILAVILLLALPLWKRHRELAFSNGEGSPDALVPSDSPLKLKGLGYALVTFLLYVAAELSMGLWGSSYLVQVRNIEISTAARWVALYYGGITFGRFISGFVSFKLSNRQMIRFGILISMTGAVLMLLHLSAFVTMAAFILIGLGFAPIFPSMIHETPVRFGKNNASVIIGYQMAAAYTGGTILPPIFGVVGRNISMTLFPPYILLCILLILISTERLNKTASRQ